MGTHDTHTMQVQLASADEARLTDLERRLGELDVSVEKRPAHATQKGEFGTVLIMALGAGAMAAVAKTMFFWLQSKKDVTLEISSSSSTARIDSETLSEDIVRQLGSLSSGGGSRKWPP